MTIEDGRAVGRRRLAMKRVWGVAGVIAVFAVGLGGGSVLSRYVFARQDQPAAPKLSEFARPPGELPRDRASLPPIGLSPEEPRRPDSEIQLAGAEQAPKIPWADPYPAHPFTLTDQDGQRVSLRDLSGKVVLVNFIYTNCKTTCPLETEELKRLHKNLGPRMGRDVVFLSITIDPGRDTPGVLRRYGEGYGVDFRSWKFLTGPQKTVREVLEAYRVSVRVEHLPGTPTGSYELGHGNPVYLIDQWGRVRKRTAPTMLVRIGQPAIEWLVREGASDADADEDSERLKSRRRR